jgi:predicted enzyme related to lactoylglutathione lyase
MKILNILVRRCLPLENLEDGIAYYEALTDQKARLRFDYPEYSLKLAQVASILFIAGTQESLAPFVATHATFLVDDIHAYAEYLPNIGATVIEPPKQVPTGWNMLVQHPDGMLVEYVEHRDKHPADRLPDEDYRERVFFPQTGPSSRSRS